MTDTEHAAPDRYGIVCRDRTAMRLGPLAALKKSAPQLVKASVGADSVAEGVAAISSNDTAGKVEQTLVEKTAEGWSGRSWAAPAVIAPSRPQRLQAVPRVATRCVTSCLNSCSRWPQRRWHR